jgi:hypothetical protein
MSSNGRNERRSTSDWRRLAPWIVFAATLLLLALLTHDRVFMSGNDASRLATIEALADQGQANIDDSRYAWTVDRVTIEGRDYSNKPPLLGIVGAGVYLITRPLLGLGFDAAESRTVYLLTLLLVGLATAALAARFHRALGAYSELTAAARLMITAALAAGTILTSFSTTLNNHPLAALLLFAACLAACSGKGLAAGVWIGLTLSIDILPGVVFAPLLGWVAQRNGGTAALRRYGLALALGVVLFVAVNWLFVGSPLPPKLVPGAVDHSADFGPADDALKVNVPVNLFPDDWTMPLQALFGWRGFFSVSPVLLFGVAGLWVAARRGDAPVERTSVALIGLGCIVLTLGHVVLIGSFGGWSYGYRYLIPIVPLLLFFAPHVVRGKTVYLFAVALCISVTTALVGAYHPWPPLHEPEMDDREDPWLAAVTNPVGANLSGWLTEHFPDGATAERAGAAFVSDDPRLRTQYLYVFHRSRGDEQAALAELRRFVERQPAAAGARHQLACALLLQGAMDEARAELERALVDSPGFLQARVGLGALLAATGDLDAARFHFNQALRMQPGLPPALAGLARLDSSRPVESRWEPSVVDAFVGCGR